MEKTQSQQSIDSVDSSLAYSFSQSTQSTEGTLSVGDIAMPLKQHKKQKENVRFQQGNAFGNFNNEELFGGGEFIGFVGLGKGNLIKINQSKMKRALKFMQDSPVFMAKPKLIQLDDEKQIDNVSQSTQSVCQLPHFVQEKQKDEEEYPDFSLGFKCLGSGNDIKVSDESNNRVRMMFGEYQRSQRKTTKSKIIDLNQKAQDFIKTQKVKVNVSQKNKISKAQKKAAFNETKKIVDDILINNNNYTQKIKLSDLPNIPLSAVKQFQIYWRKQKQYSVVHTSKNCEVKWCYFCQKYRSQQFQVNKQSLENEISSMIQLQQRTKLQIPKFIELVIFKLSRYSFFSPTPKNKQLNPNNILLETYRKCQATQKQKIGSLQISFGAVLANPHKVLGKQINLVVISIDYNEQMQNYFIGLTDGWALVYAVINCKNNLYPFICKKLFVGSKIQIVNWGIYAIGNMIQHHPCQKVAASKQKCIEFTFNNSMPSPFYSKLGWPKQLFYRPVSKCKEGFIPLIQGIVVRMFKHKENKIQGNFIEVLLKQGNCAIIRVPLTQQQSLNQLFRLYYCYHFFRVKKTSKELQFFASSKFYEIEDKSRMTKVKALLQNRLLNHTKQIKQKLKEPENKYIDLVTKSGEFKIQDLKVQVQQKVDGTVLLQQYTATYLSQKLIISKGDRGCYLRVIPKVYENISYEIF